MKPDPHQHLKDYKALLDALDGRTVRIGIIRGDRQQIEEIAAETAMAVLDYIQRHR